MRYSNPLQSASKTFHACCFCAASYSLKSTLAFPLSADPRARRRVPSSAAPGPASRTDPAFEPRETLLVNKSAALNLEWKANVLVSRLEVLDVNAVFILIQLP